VCEEMIKVTFDISDYDQREEIKRLMNGLDALSTMNDIYNKCRSALKHGDLSDNEGLVNLIEQIKADASEF